MPQVPGAGARGATTEATIVVAVGCACGMTWRVALKSGRESGASRWRANSDGGTPPGALWRRSGVRDRRSHGAPWAAASVAIAAARAGDASLYKGCAEV